MRTPRLLGLLGLVPASFLLLHCGGEIDDAGEDLGPYAEQMPWNERMATSAMDTVGGVADSSACTTAAISALSDQIVFQINCIHPGLMDRIDNANVSFTSGAALPYLQQPAAQALRDATKGRSRLPLNSNLRTVAQQWILYHWYTTGRCGVQLAAHPGHSNHEDGLAFDTSQYSTWRATLSGYSYRWFGPADVVHFDYTKGGPPAHGVQAFQRLWNRHNPGDRIAEDGSYGPQTEDRIKRSPRLGFSGPQSCS